MKKFKIVGNIRFFAYIVILVQGLLLSLLLMNGLDSYYLNNWRSYPQDKNATTFYLKQIPEDKILEISGGLLGLVDSENVFIARQDDVSGNDGFGAGCKLGVYGNTNLHGTEMSFLGTNIFTQKDLEELLQSENDEATLGIDKGSINSLASIPNFRFSTQKVVKKLPQLIKDSNTLNGEYTVIGLTTTSEKEEFVSQLSSVTGIPKEKLLTPSSGGVRDGGLITIMIVILFAIQSLTLLIAFVLISAKCLKKFGVLALQGWNRKAFIYAIYSPFINFSIICMPLLLVASYIFYGWNHFSLPLLNAIALALVVNFIMVLLEILVGSVVILAARPIDAIRGRNSKKPLYILAATAYVFISIGVVASSLYLDMPVKMLSENNKISKEWKAVSNYQILSSLSMGEDEETIKGNTNKLDADMYGWYKTIADKEGVLLVKTTYFNQDALQMLQGGIFGAVPSKPFWDFIVSPSYLETIGLTVPEDIIKQAWQGKRLYLVPSTLTAKEKEIMVAFYKKMELQGVDPEVDIPTVFNKEQEFIVYEYTPEKEFFTWRTKDDEPLTTTAPFIYVATPENMTFTTSESLRASGFNSYLKFANAQVLQQALQPQILKQFNLDDNNLHFAPIQMYIDGEQKSIAQTFSFFIIIFILTLFVLSITLVALSIIYKNNRQETICVKKFLGYGYWGIYKTPTILLLSVILVELLICVIARSNYGIGLVFISGIIQLIILKFYLTKNDLKDVLIKFKGE